MRLISMTILALLIWSCSTPKKVTGDKPRKSKLVCNEVDILDRHAKLFTLAQTNSFKSCLKTHMNLHKLDQLNVDVCSNLRIDHNSNISNVSVQISPEYKDLKWCIEQELRSIDLSLLSVKKPRYISFLINFKVLGKK